MTDVEVVESLQNSWRALNEIYDRQPDNAVRIAMNIVVRIVEKNGLHFWKRVRWPGRAA